VKARATITVLSLMQTAKRGEYDVQGSRFNVIDAVPSSTLNFEP